MLPRQWVPRLRDLIPGSTNFYHIPPHLHTHVYPQHICILGSTFLLLSRSSPRQVCLMFPALRMRKVGAIVLVNRET